MPIDPGIPSLALAGLQRSQPFDLARTLDDAALVQERQTRVQQAQRDMQSQQRLQQLAQQYGNDPDELVKQLGTEFPEQAQKLSQEIGKARYEGVQAHLAQTKDAQAQISAGLSLLQGTTADTWKPVRQMLVKMAPQLDPVLDQEYSDEGKQRAISMGLSAEQWTKGQQEAAQLYVDGKHDVSAARLLASADNPQKRSIAEGLLKQAGLSQYAAMWQSPQDAQSYLDAQKKDVPDKLQSPEQEAIKAYARDHGKDPSALSQKELEQIHRGFKESGTVVRVTAGGGGSGATDAKSIAKAIINGDQPPDMKGLYRFTGPVRAELARQGYNLTKATEDWTGTQKYLATLNGAQQTRLRQAVEFTRESLPIVQDLVTQWDSAGLPLLSKANLDAAASGAYGAKQQSLAVRLKGQIADLTSELGTVYKGGNSSTDESLKLAAQNLQGNWSKQAALDALKQIDTNLTIRANSIRNTGPIANEGNQYAPQTGPPAAKKPDYRFNPATGKLERVQ